MESLFHLHCVSLLALLFGFTSQAWLCMLAMAIYEPSTFLCVYMSFIVQPVNSVKCVSRTEYHRRINAIARGYKIELSSTYELRTVLLKVEADVNVFPSRYPFSPLILCLILRSSSSTLRSNGESEACYIPKTKKSLSNNVHAWHLNFLWFCMLNLSQGTFLIKIFSVVEQLFFVPPFLITYILTYITHNTKQELEINYQ